MKITVFIVAFFLVLKPILPVLDYVINYGYIIKVLCINQAKPELACNGKCHLMQQMAKTSESEKPISNEKKQVTSEFETLFFQDIQAVLHVFNLSKEPLQNINFSKNLYQFLLDGNCFHPPSLNF